MKTCFKCNQTKPLSDFYTHKRMADGHLNKCKACTKADSRANSRSERGAEVQRRCKQDWDRRNVERSNLAKALWIARNKVKRMAQNAVSNALAYGKLSKLPCFCCGNDVVEAHHPDYSHPLDVIWLCQKHHKEVHRKF